MEGNYMKLTELKLKNFRGYKDTTSIIFDNLTTFVGKNDIGKSTILEALDLFFNDNKGIVKLDKNDINKQAILDGEDTIEISACFDELPNITLDATYETQLNEEYLLNSSNQLEIIKRYPKAGSAKVFIKAYHPTNENCKDLLLKKNTELKAIIKSEHIQCSNLSINAIMRRSIWEHYCTDLCLSEVELDITKGETKQIYEKLQSALPLYSLFQADRKNSDNDSEVQDPLKEAVKQILQDDTLKSQLTEIASEIESKLQEVANRTLEKLHEMNPEVANSLNPIIPPAESLKWSDVFKNVSIAGDDDIPINKRGSGVKRLILLNFFRAEAERRRYERNSSSIIYAIEEPETSQHTKQQCLLINALLTLAEIPNTQIILTTHSANIVKALSFNNLRLITTNGTTKSISPVLQGQLPYPSLNEVNFLAFNETSEEYHNELYGYIEAEGKLNTFKSTQPTVSYTKQLHSGTRTEQITLTEYIRHQIHHPENTSNPRYTLTQLEHSICLMRDFIQLSC